MSPQREVGHHEVLWLLGSLSGFYRLPFDATLIAQQFPPPYTIATLHEAAGSLGLKTGDVSIIGLDWQKLPLPAIAFLRPVPHPLAANDECATSASDPIVAEASSSSLPVLILKSADNKLLYFRAGSQTELPSVFCLP